MSDEPVVADLTPSFFERDEDGLVKGLVYSLRADKRIDWVKMIPPQHIVFNSKMDATLEKIYGATSYNLNYANLIAEGKEIDPKHVLVLLMGFIELADLRGYQYANPRIAHVCSYPLEAAICSCECTIDWLPNREEPNGKSSYGTADATMENTGGWGYLSAMAGNRAFVRAVRQGLRIPILGFDEIAKKDTVIPEAASEPISSSNKHMANTTLRKHSTANGLSFDKVKQAAAGKYRDKMSEDPVNWKGWDDLPPPDCLTLIKIILENAQK